MKILLVTEKYNPDDRQRDGGARLVETLKQNFAKNLDIIQFDQDKKYADNRWNCKYPINLANRFARRMANAEFIAEQVHRIAKGFSCIIFAHVSMQFKCQIEDNVTTWTFPMFLTPSYKISGEIVSPDYTAMEKIALSRTNNIITPSYFEKKTINRILLSFSR